MFTFPTWSVGTFVIFTHATSDSLAAMACIEQKPLIELKRPFSTYACVCYITYVVCNYPHTSPSFFAKLTQQGRYIPTEVKFLRSRVSVLKVMTPHIVKTPTPRDICLAEIGIGNFAKKGLPPR